MPDVWEATEEILRAVRSPARLLVSFDYDGTLAPIVERPEMALPTAGVRDALERLARRPDVVVAIVTGRSLGALAELFDFERAWRVGRHGAELAPPGGSPEPMDGIDVSRLARALDGVREPARAIAARHPGAWLEDKQTSLALHTRRCTADDERRAAEELRDLAGSLEGFGVLAGKRVTEMRPLALDKGRALLALCRRAAPGAAIVHVGDDATDEDAFVALGRVAGSFGVRVMGPEARADTAARYWLDSPARVPRFIDWMAEARAGSEA